MTDIYAKMESMLKQAQDNILVRFMDEHEKGYWDGRFNALTELLQYKPKEDEEEIEINAYYNPRVRQYFGFSIRSLQPIVEYPTVKLIVKRKEII